MSLLCTSAALAQRVLVGDMNNDGKLTIADVTELTNTILGKQESKFAYSATDFIKENKLSGRYKVNGIENNYINGEYDPYNAHEYVDLGLSVKWATCNVGANSPEGYGNYYSWGEVEPKASYGWASYRYCNGTFNSITKYCTSANYGVVDKKSVLEPSDDVAHVNWGGSWRMPTRAEQNELCNKCTWVRTKDYKGTKVAGYIVTSDIPGYTDKSIFLPDAGCYSEKGPIEVGNYGYYWSNELYPYLSYGAYGIYLTTVSVEWDLEYRNYGMSVRAVCPVK